MLIPMPSSPAPRKIEWTIDQPGQANRGEFTGRRRVTLLPAAPRLYASVTMPPIVGEQRVLDWRAFVFDCDGIANQFRVIACERPQIGGAPVVQVHGGGQFGRTLATRGWGSAGLKLQRGQFVTIGEQLLMLTAAVIADDAGRATLTFKPYIRVVPADGDLVEVTRPYAVMAMSDPKAGWVADVGQQYEVKFECEEAF